MLRIGLLLVVMLNGGCPRAGRLPVSARPPSTPSASSLESFGADAVSGALATALTDGRRAIGAPAAAQVVLRGNSRWASASGWAERGKREVQVEDVFRIGSITKMYVAAVLVSLHVEGKLSLDDPASRWVPEAPHGDRYTLRQLLAHQTGLRDFVPTMRFGLHLGRKETMRDLLDIVADRSLHFEPGTDCRYSNTNFLVAGLAIEAATGRPWGVEVRERLLEPLGLEHTWIPSVDGEPDGIVRGYVAGLDVTKLFEPSRASAGGEIVATADDVARFVQALFFEDLVDPEVLRLMTTEVPTSDGHATGHGLGTKMASTPYGPLIGHSGSTVSFQSRVHVHEASRTIVVSLANNFFSEADELDDRAWTVLADTGVLAPHPLEDPTSMVAGTASRDEREPRRRRAE